MQIYHSKQHSKKATFASLPLLISLLTLIPFSNVFADTDYQVQSGDSLSKIIAKNYPDVARESYNVIMQHTLAKNPDAFSNKNINSLRLGKTLTLTAKENIEGLKPKPPAPVVVPLTTEEFEKLKSQNSKLESQLKTLTDELEKLKSTPNNTGGTPISSTENTVDSTQTDDLQAKVDQLLAQVKQLEIDKQALESKIVTPQISAEELEESTKLISQLQAEIEILKAESTNQNEVDTATIEKQLTDSQEELKQLKEQLVTLEAGKQEQTKTSDDLQAANKQIEALQADVEQLNALIIKLEADQQDSVPTKASSAKQEELQAEVDLLQSLIAKNEADQEESDALIKQLEEKIASLGGDTTAQPEGESVASNNDEQLNKLQQENNLLKAEIEKAREKANQDNATISQLKSDLATATTPTQVSPASPTTTSTENQQEPSTWLKLSMLSWLLPLLAILIGLYLLSRLIKRNRDKQATEDFKTAMATSASSNTASAFGIDGSAPAPHSNQEKDSVLAEEDSLEAGVKIDIARAYIDLNETEAANEILQEAIVEGSSSQKKTAEELIK